MHQDVTVIQQIQAQEIPILFENLEKKIESSRNSLVCAIAGRSYLVSWKGRLEQQSVQDTRTF